MEKLTITISVEELHELTEAALKAKRMWIPLKTAEAACQRRRDELRRLQAQYAELKAKISGAGASGEPQENETNADEPKADAVLFKNETEGRVSGGDRAGLDNGSEACK